MRAQFLALLLSAVVPTALSLASTSLTLTIPPTNLLPNPAVLPPSTHATLSSLHRSFSAPLSTANAFVFHNVTAGSYLADIHCPTHVFAALRVDVEDDGVSTGEGGLRIRVWETYRGNDWGNKGQEFAASKSGFSVPALATKEYFIERGGFNILSILKNPMILLGGVSMLLYFGMPKLIDNMDPEMRQEWEESQKSNPVASLMGGAAGGQQGQAANPMANFDMAAYLAGSNKGNSDGNSGSGGRRGGR